jgi:hypothetical protein
VASRCDLRYPAQNELQPRFPFPVITCCLQEIVITLTMLFEEMRKVEKRGRQDPVLYQQERDQQTTYSAVSIQKGVNRFELSVGEPYLY